jgi:hypothetical protein
MSLGLLFTGNYAFTFAGFAFSGLFTFGYINQSIIALVEWGNIKFRNYTSLFALGSSCVSGFIISASFPLVSSWRLQLILFMFIPLLLLIFPSFYLLETPKYFYARGKMEDCKQVINKVAGINGRPEIILEIKEKKKKKNHYTYLDLFKERQMRSDALANTFIWFSAEIVYYGMFLLIPDLPGSSSFNTFLASLVGIIAYFFLSCTPLLLTS